MNKTSDESETMTRRKQRIVTPEILRVPNSTSDVLEEKKSPVEPRATKQQTRQDSPAPTNINYFMFGNSQSLSMIFF